MDDREVIHLSVLYSLSADSLVKDGGLLDGGGSRLSSQYFMPWMVLAGVSMVTSDDGQLVDETLVVRSILIIIYMHIMAAVKKEKEKHIHVLYAKTT